MMTRRRAALDLRLVGMLLPLVGAMMTMRAGPLPDDFSGLLPLVGAMMTACHVESGDVFTMLLPLVDPVG